MKRGKIPGPVNRAAPYHEVVRGDVLAGSRHVWNHSLGGGVPSNGGRAAAAGAGEAAAAGAVPARGGGLYGEEEARQRGGCSGEGTGGAGRQDGCSRGHGHGGHDGERAEGGDKSYPVEFRANGTGV